MTKGTATPASEKAQRLREAAAAVLRAAPGRRLNTVVLNKALFYLDLLSLLEEGDTVTHAPYVALEQGPVVAQYKKRLVDNLEKAGLARQSKEGMARPVELLREPEQYAYLGERALERAARVAERAARFSSSAISDRSHRNPGWQLAYEAGRGAGGSPKPIDMFIAMQELLDDDAWLSAPPDDEVEQAFSAALAGETRRWE